MNRHFDFVIFVLIDSVIKRPAYDPADLIFAPTLAFTGIPEDLHLNYAMIAAYSPSAVYVEPFARSWHGLSITDPDHMQDALLLTCLTSIIAILTVGISRLIPA